MAVDPVYPGTSADYEEVCRDAEEYLLNVTRQAGTLRAQREEWRDAAKQQRMEASIARGMAERAASDGRLSPTPYKKNATFHAEKAAHNESVAQDFERRAKEFDLAIVEAELRLEVARDHLRQAREREAAQKQRDDGDSAEGASQSLNGGGDPRAQ